MSKLIVGDVETGSINGGPLAGFRNAIINGNFDIWQRGTSFSGASTGDNYFADRWLSSRNGSGATVNVNRQTFTLGQTDVPNNPNYYINYAVTTAGSGETFHYFGQRIESVKTFAGEEVTLRFYAKASSAVTFDVGFTQNFGTGGSPSTPVVTVLDSYNVTTSFQEFTGTVTLSSVSGKTLGTDGNDHLLLFFGIPRNTTIDLDISQVQLEPGSVATPFERRPVGTELALCQRYYQDVGIITVTTLGSNPASKRGNIAFNTTMRTDPSLSGTPTSGTLTFSNISKARAYAQVTDADETANVTDITADAEL